MNENYNNLSNAELKIKMHELENEYTAIQNNIKNLIEKLEILDKKYLFIKKILENRLKGFIKL